MLEPDEKDRRAFKRIKYQDPIEYNYKESTKFGGCLSYDLSEGGLRINFYDFIPLNAELNLNFKLKNNKNISRIGRVVWTEKFPHMDRYQVGLEFKNDKDALKTKDILRIFINSC